MILCLFEYGILSSSARARTARRAVDNKVYLVHADKLTYDQYRNNGAQILNGHVHFIHKGANLTCDSAYFYEANNSFDAFGHVFMKQGDTLSLKSDYAFYDGNDQMAKARKNVILYHRGSRLYTDSLNYDRLYKIGYFFEGGKLVDKGSVLTSDWGDYNTATRKAVFNYNVKLRNKKFTLTTDTLHYDTRTSLAHIVGLAKIKSGNTDITTTRGYYNTKTEHSQFLDRSEILNKGRKIIGDSLYYDSKLGISKAYYNVVYTDLKNKNKFTGDFCRYNEKTGYAEAYNKAVAIDYSQKDTLYMHADTFKVRTYHINTDSAYRKVFAYHHVRAFRTDVQAVCDSMVYNSKDSILSMYRDPILWYNGDQQLLGEEIYVHQKDSTIDWAHVVNQALSVQRVKSDTTCYNQISSNEMRAYFVHGEIDSTLAIGNVLITYFPIDDKDSTVIELDYTETSKLKMWFKDRKMEKIWMPEVTGTMYPMTQIPPGKKYLPTFAWFDYIRPIDKNDIFKWRSKGTASQLRHVARHEAPLQHIGK